MSDRDALEAAIRADRTDHGAIAVFADWLQSNGHPAGEMIVRMQRGASAETLGASLGLPSAGLVTFEWLHGIWRAIRLENEHDNHPEPFDAVAFAASLFASPYCVALEELRVGFLRWAENAEDVPKLLASAGAYPWAAQLERLHLGDIDANIDLSHHVIGDVGAVITRAFPGLRWLKLHGGDNFEEGEVFGVGPLALSELRTFEIETCSLSKARLANVLGSALPSLARLSLWFGSVDYGCDCVVDDLRPLLDGKVLGTVVDLGLKNAEWSDAIVPALVTSAIAPRLERLDLGLGTLGPDGVAALAAAGRGAFPRLVTLAIDGSWVDAASVAGLRQAFDGVEITATDLRADREGVTRYPSHWE